jgi:16S rRNA C1402 (ribose-2'-O) methylase RsmI
MPATPARRASATPARGWRRRRAPRGLPVVPVPGASSITALLSATGGVGDDGGFVFFGFLPAKGGERQQAVEALRQETRAVVLLEAPHRIAALADTLAVLGAREITIGRENHQAVRGDCHAAL